MSEIASSSTQTNSALTLSVVVVSSRKTSTLARCLASLSAQSADEILVVDSSDEDPAASLRSRFPYIHFLHFHPLLSVPELRREGIHRAKGDIVALTESWMIPGEDWVNALREAHRKFPEAPAVGGPISFPCSEHNPSTLEWADYFSEYGEQIPERASEQSGCRSCESLSGANVSYKRWAVERCRELLARGSWEGPIHERLKHDGYQLLRAEDAEVCYRRVVTSGEVLRERFSHGRDHAAERLRDASTAERLVRGAASPLVPWLLFWRLGARIPPCLSNAFWLSAAWLLALNWAWAAGEAVGSWFGPERRP